MAKKRRVYPEDHVFADGQSLRNVRDAMVAAAKTGMWHVAFSLAHQYNVQEAFCMACGGPLGQAQGTYIQRSGLAIRICGGCHRVLPRNH